LQSSDFTPQELEMLLREVQRRVLARISERRDIDVRVAINDIARQVIIDKKPAMLPRALEFTEEAYTRLFSLGPLEKYLQPGSAVTNMIIFGTKLLVEEHGEKRIENAFTSEEEVLRIFERIANRVGKELSIAVPSAAGGQALRVYPEAHQEGSKAGRTLPGNERAERKR